MRNRVLIGAAALAVGAALALAQQLQQAPQALLRAQDAASLAKRILQLIESTAASVPGLARSSAPILEDAKQSTAQLNMRPNHAGYTADLVNHTHAYLALADSMPKPYPFAEEARRQFAELRESSDRLNTHFRALLDQKETQLRNPDRDNLKRYAEANEKIEKPAAGQARIVFLGDSITDGWRLNEYFPGKDILNRGISGQITGEMLGRMKADVIDLNPAAMVVLAGTNDLARGVPVPVIANNLTMIADLAESHHIRPIFCSVLPVSDYHKNKDPRFEMTPSRPPAQIRELNQWLQTFSRQRGFTYVDYFGAMVDASGMLQANLADDGLHPNAAGYRVMAPLVQQAIDRTPAAAPARKKKGFWGSLAGPDAPKSEK